MTVDDLERRRLAALDDLLDALQLEPLGEDRFRVAAEPGRFRHMFGGQLIAQALSAAAATVEGKLPHSMHAYFVEAGATNVPVELAVTRVRDGRSISTRTVTLIQSERTLLTAQCSFHTGDAQPCFGDAPPSIAAPESLLRLEEWGQRAPAEIRPFVDAWFERPPPVEIRMVEPLHFMGGPASTESRSHWLRLPRPVAGPLSNTILLAYASDYFLLDMVTRANPGGQTLEDFAGFSVDHSLWFHSPPRLDQWHLYTMHPQAVAGERGLVRGVLHDGDGALVASVMQEGLIRGGGKR